MAKKRLETVHSRKQRYLACVDRLKRKTKAARQKCYEKVYK